MPSSPTAKVPARSIRMPPIAAIRIGVAMRTVAPRKSTMRRVVHQTLRGGPQPTAHSTKIRLRPWITSTSEEGMPIWRCIDERAGLQEREEQRGGDHPERVERREQRDGDALKPKPKREAFDQPVVHAEHLDRARDAGEHAATSITPSTERARETPA